MLADRSSVVLCVVILLLVALGIHLGRDARLNWWNVRHPRPRSCAGSPCTCGVVVGPVIAGLVRVEDLRGG